MYKLIVSENGYEGHAAEELDLEDLKEEIICLEEDGVGDQGKRVWGYRKDICLKCIISSSSSWEELALALNHLFDAKEKEKEISWTSDLWEGSVEIRIERE